ncbi:hypothetical protein OsI_20029 [Oryza sativa Indica Group]|uniref:DUF632 domain-containing protein n=1 Tax=Oryza sativa subsp. indica TaxID=39946 RepID=A2Y4V3_ORYSI|nr:hypothetical protein OsI_20029 [Oryza sativa Indica Group]
MGCRSSRLDAADASPVAALCRERRDLLRAAAERRAALAAAHAAYFRALPRVADALARFAEQHHAATPPGSPVLTLPPSEPDEHKKRSASSSTLHTDSGHSHLHFHTDGGSDSEPNSADDDCACGAAAGAAGHGAVKNLGLWGLFTRGLPLRILMIGILTGTQWVIYDSFKVMVGLISKRLYNFTGPPPMPMPEVSPWDFFNPFDSYDYNQQLPQYKDANGSFTSSPNSSEVREREGIPELEEETEQESMRESIKARKAVESTASTRIDNADAVNAKAKTASMEHKECEIESVGSASVLDSGEESVCSCECDHADGNAGAGAATAAPAGDDPRMVKKVASEEHSSMVVAEDVLPKNFGTRDVADVVNEIKEQFNYVVACGDDVARILEVGSMRYRPRRRIVRLVFSRLMGAFALLFSSVSEPPVENLEQTALSASGRNHNSSQRIGSASDIEFNTLSSVMDRLYVWEKRLHKEIMEEEKLRITYDKQWKRLKELDDNGAEPYKIDSTRASISTLLTRINITIRSAKVISRRIHILRDDELHPHLVKLIQGLVRMWKFILECHRKQFHAILETKSHVLIPKNGPERNSKITFELEMELLNWCSCFSNWILSQKAYIETLNGWLVKWLPEEKEETPDGIAPFSPGRLGAPAVFITANDWCQSMKRIPEGTVIGAMEAFAVNVHMLRERQDEEQQQKLKADYYLEIMQRGSNLFKRNMAWLDIMKLIRRCCLLPKITEQLIAAW